MKSRTLFLSTPLAALTLLAVTACGDKKPEVEKTTVIEREVQVPAPAPAPAPAPEEKDGGYGGRIGDKIDDKVNRRIDEAIDSF